MVTCAAFMVYTMYKRTRNKLENEGMTWEEKALNLLIKRKTYRQWLGHGKILHLIFSHVWGPSRKFLTASSPYFPCDRCGL